MVKVDRKLQNINHIEMHGAQVQRSHLMDFFLERPQKLLGQRFYEAAF